MKNDKIIYSSQHAQFLNIITHILCLTQTAVEKTFNVGPKEINVLDDIFLNILNGLSQALIEGEELHKQRMLN